MANRGAANRPSRVRRPHPTGGHSRRAQPIPPRIEELLELELDPVFSEDDEDELPQSIGFARARADLKAGCGAASSSTTEQRVTSR